MMGKININEYLDKDFFANKQMQLSEEERKEVGNKCMDLQIFVRKNLLMKGKISKIVFNRWAKGMYSMYGYLKHEFMMPSEFDEKFGTKQVNMKYFGSACKKVKEELKRLSQSQSIMKLKEKGK